MGHLDSFCDRARGAPSWKARIALRVRRSASAAKRTQGVRENGEVEHVPRRRGRIATAPRDSTSVISTASLGAEILILFRGRADVRSPEWAEAPRHEHHHVTAADA
jgi:hypothetical protein